MTHQTITSFFCEQISDLHLYLKDCAVCGLRCSTQQNVAKNESCAEQSTWVVGQFPKNSFLLSLLYLLLILNSPTSLGCLLTEASSLANERSVYHRSIHPPPYGVSLWMASDPNSHPVYNCELYLFSGRCKPNAIAVCHMEMRRGINP